MRWSFCGSSFAEPTCPAWETHCLLKNTGFGPAAISQKRVSHETSKHGSGTLPLLGKVTLQFHAISTFTNCVLWHVLSTILFFLLSDIYFFSSNLVIALCKDCWISAARKFLNYNTCRFTKHNYYLPRTNLLSVLLSSEVWSATQWRRGFARCCGPHTETQEVGQLHDMICYAEMVAWG